MYYRSRELRIERVAQPGCQCATAGALLAMLTSSRNGGCIAVRRRQGRKRPSSGNLASALPPTPGPKRLLLCERDMTKQHYIDRPTDSTCALCPLQVHVGPWPQASQIAPRGAQARLRRSLCLGRTREGSAARRRALLGAPDLDVLCKGLRRRLAARAHSLVDGVARHAAAEVREQLHVGRVPAAADGALREAAAARALRGGGATCCRST